jgi:hypothetical protein
VTERETLLLWLETEAANHQGIKFADFLITNDQWMAADPYLSDESEWWRQLTQYIARVRMFGLETPQGRQAYMKFIATALGAGESMLRVFGNPPQPGVPSGEIRQWVND